MKYLINTETKEVLSFNDEEDVTPFTSRNKYQPVKAVPLESQPNMDSDPDYWFWGIGTASGLDIGTGMGN